MEGFGVSKLQEMESIAMRQAFRRLGWEPCWWHIRAVRKQACTCRFGERA